MYRTKIFMYQINMHNLEASAAEKSVVKCLCQYQTFFSKGYQSLELPVYVFILFSQAF